MKPKPIQGKLPILISLLILVLATMWLVGRCSRSNESPIVRQFQRPGGDTLSVAIELAPTSYSFEGDSAAGFDYEMFKEIAKQHNLPVKFHPFAPIDYALKGLKTGDFDIVVANVPASTNLQEEFNLTNDVFVDRQVLVRLKRQGDSIQTQPSQMELLGDTVWVADSTPFKERLLNLSHELGDTIYILSDPDYNSEQLVLLTALGEIRQAVVNESVAKRLSSDYPQLDMSVPISMTQFQPWIVNKSSNELRDSLNSWIDEFKQTTDYQKLVDKYFKN